jgi:hypothetical protein
MLSFKHSFTSNVFYSKVIHTRVEPDGATDMFPEAWRVGLFKVSMSSQPLFQ